MGDKEDYEKCVDQQTTEFNTYDQYVDVVSCWEEFLTGQYSDVFGDFFFDRFPSIPRSDKDPLTPDFTVFFNQDYGMVFEVSRTMPESDEAFESELDQLRSYDSELKFKTSAGRETPEKHDIVLVVGSSDSFTIADRISSKIDDGELELESNLVLLEYMYTEQDKDPGYQFRRIPLLDQNFRDDVLPSDKKLSEKTDSEGGYDNIFVPPDYFFEYKVVGVLCNDTPPSVYLACYLWNKVFYDYLDDSQQDVWKQKNPNKILEIEIDLDELQSEINNEYIPDGFVRRNWLEKTLNYLVVADLAVEAEDSDYTVKFRNLTRKRNKFQEKVSKKTKFSDLAQLFAEWYCKNRVGMDEDKLEDVEKEKTSEKTGQKALGEFN